MTPFDLGETSAGEPLAIDLDALIGAHACVAANSGGGKSGLIRRLLETTHGHVQHLVLDAEDEFYTLRERFDYVIAGGEGGDAPATVANAPALARAALTNGFSLIAQVNDLGEGAADFIAAFCDALIAAPRELWRPLLVVIDEAQRFAPSTGASAATSAIKNLLQRGRKRGFTAIVASTRVSELHPGVRGLCRNWMLGLVGQALDRRTAADQLGFPPSSAEARELQELATRQFWGFGPAIARKPVLFTVGDVATTIIKSGQAKVPTAPAPEALREILAGLAAPAPDYPDDTIPADPAEALRKGGAVGTMLAERDRRIAELETTVADQRDELEHLREVDAECEGYNAGLTAIEDLVLRVRSGEYRAKLHHGDASSGAIPELETAPEAALGPPPVAEVAPPAAGVSLSPPPGGAADTALRRGRKALVPLAEIYPAVLTEAQWATLTGLAKSGGTWGTYKTVLRSAGYVRQDSVGLWQATKEGCVAAGVTPAKLPPIGAARAQFWAAKISGSKRLVDVLVHRWPHWTTRDGLAADANLAPSGGTFGTYLGRLRSNGLIDESGKRVRLAADIMGKAP